MKYIFAISFLLGAVVLGLTGCDGNDPKRLGSSATSTQRTSTPVRNQSASPSAVPVPAADPKLRSLVVGSGTGDSPESWQVNVGSGPVWVAVNCLGVGKLEIGVQPTANFGIPCDASAMTPSLNEIILKHAKTWTVTVKGPSSVSWTVRVSQ